MSGAKAYGTGSVNVKFCANPIIEYISRRIGCQRFSPTGGPEVMGGNPWFFTINGKILSGAKNLENQTNFDFSVKDFLTRGGWGRNSEKVGRGRKKAAGAESRAPAAGRRGIRNGGGASGRFRPGPAGRSPGARRRRGGGWGSQRFHHVQPMRRLSTHRYPRQNMLPLNFQYGGRNSTPNLHLRGRTPCWSSSVGGASQMWGCSGMAQCWSMLVPYCLTQYTISAPVHSL